ncbi:Helix-turn-helix domain-containing protein [Lachnospiraceae bacterium NLAE-zl-G231]|nr:Helix-turn-helix domain-containing protein [Lachnospiraceae bacterium NLAE-zl-G231]
MKYRKVYIRLIITYLAIFLLPLIINIVMLENLAVSTRENICASVHSNMAHTMDTLDNNFREINTITARISGNSNIRYIATQMDEEGKKIEISKITYAQEYMAAMQIQTFVEEYYVLFRKPDMVISPNRVYLYQDSWNAFFQYGDMSWEEWKALMTGHYTGHLFPEEKTKQNGNVEDRILFVQSLVTDSGVKGNLIFPIRSEGIKNLMRDAYISQDGWAYLLDETNEEIILTVPAADGSFEKVPSSVLENGQEIQEIELNGKTVEVIRVDSDHLGMTYISVLPKEYITLQINRDQQKLILLMTAVLFVGIGSILLVSWKRGRRIDGILQMLFSMGVEDKESLKGDEMEYISNSLKQLIDNNTDLQESIIRQKPVTRSLLLERLLHGGEGVSLQSLEDYGINLKGKRMLVIAFLVGRGDSADVELYAKETVVYKQVLQQSLDSLLAGDKYMCDTDMDSSVVICTMEGGFQPANAGFQKKLEKITETFWEEFGVKVRIAVSTICRELTEISKAYDQVCEMLTFGDSSGKTVVFYEDYQDSKEFYYFPVTLEERLVNAVRTGNAESMHAQLSEVYQVNVLSRNISPSMMHFLVNDLQCAVFKALHSLNDRVEIEEEEIYRQLEQLNRENDILLRFNHINSMFKYICDMVKAVNKESSSRQLEEIEQYICDHYMDSDMGLTKISDDFGYASTYFSKLFKELFGENFATYLEKMRIEKVCELLKKGYTMEKIAEQTGYNSVYVMRTAFKRIKGMTPNEFRKLNEEETE